MDSPVARSAIVLSVLTVLFGCGGGGGSGNDSDSDASACQVDPDQLSNGATRETATSVWHCTADSIPDFSFMFFRDGTGQSSAIGQFEWTETSCGIVEVEGEIPQTISDISIQPSMNEASFVTEQETVTASVSCESQSDKPAPRSEHAASYDRAEEEMVIYGGNVSFDDADTRITIADTWTFDGSSWDQIETNVVPPISSSRSLVYDSHRDKSILLLGQPEKTTLQTWEYDDGEWNHRNFDISPSQRTSFHIAYDSTRNAVVLFGGRSGSDGTGSRLYDTWEYDGTEWTKRVEPDGQQCSSSSSNSPCVASGSMAAMSYDPPRGKTVLVGKSASSTDVRTYEWNGNSWSERQPTQEPDIPSFGALAHDHRRNVNVLVTPQVWEWDGTRWDDKGINTGRLKQTMVYSSKAMEMLLFGGTESGQLTNAIQTFDGGTLE